MPAGIQNGPVDMSGHQEVPAATFLLGQDGVSHRKSLASRSQAYRGEERSTGKPHLNPFAIGGAGKGVFPEKLAEFGWNPADRKHRQEAANSAIPGPGSLNEGRAGTAGSSVRDKRQDWLPHPACS
jgi:hypothetical protein